MAHLLGCCKKSRHITRLSQFLEFQKNDNECKRESNYFKIKMESVDSNHLLALSCGAVYISPSVWILQQFSNQFKEYMNEKYPLFFKQF